MGRQYRSIRRPEYWTTGELSRSGGSVCPPGVTPASWSSTELVRHLERVDDHPKLTVILGLSVLLRASEEPALSVNQSP